MKPDKSGFYYTRLGAEGPRIFYHVMGSDPAEDPQIFGKGYGPDKIISAGVSSDGRYPAVLFVSGDSARAWTPSTRAR